MKKSIYCLLCLSFFTLMLTGCGDTQIDTPIASSSENSSELSSETSHQVASVEQKIPVKILSKEDILKIKENTTIQQILDAWGETQMEVVTLGSRYPSYSHLYQIVNGKEFTFSFSSYEAVYPYGGEMILKIIEKTGALNWSFSLNQNAKVVAETKTTRTYEYTDLGAVTSDFIDIKGEKHQYTYLLTFPKPIYIESSIIMTPFQTYQDLFDYDAMKIGGLESVIRMENITTIPDHYLFSDGYGGMEKFVSHRKYIDKNGNTVDFVKNGAIIAGPIPETIYPYYYHIQTPDNLVVTIYFFSRVEHDKDNEKMFQEIVDSFEFVK